MLYPATFAVYSGLSHKPIGDLGQFNVDLSFLDEGAPMEAEDDTPGPKEQ